MMGTLGVITCQSLELELAYIMAKDPDVVSITVMKDHYSGGFSEGIERFGGSIPKSILYIGEFLPGPPNGISIVVRVMRIGLHVVIKDLRNAVIGVAREMWPYVDAILLGYGLCGNALENPDELFSTIDVPVFLPMEEDHPVDDCVGLLVGGRENYYEEQRACAGTMFINSGFARYWNEIEGDILTGSLWPSRPGIMERLLANYKRMLFLPSPVMSCEEMASRMKDFGETHGLRTEVRPGTLDLLCRAWKSAKKGVFMRSGEHADG